MRTERALARSPQSFLTDHREDASRQAAGEFGGDAFLPKKALIALLLSVKSSKERLS